MARLSYFAEKRGQNNDPNFFNNTPVDEIRKNVKRIIRDIRNNLIQDEDWSYFHSSQILQACIAEAQENYTSSVVLCNALNFYINEGINKGIRPFPTTDLVMERMYANKEQITQNARSKNWYTILQMFLAINNGYDARTVLTPLRMLDGRDLACL